MSTGQNPFFHVGLGPDIESNRGTGSSGSYLKLVGEFRMLVGLVSSQPSSMKGIGLPWLWR